MRLTIEITEKQHQYMKSSASMEGKTLQNYVLDRVFLDADEVLKEDEDLKEILKVLKPRIEAAKRGETVDTTVDEITKAAIERAKQANENTETGTKI